MQEMQVNKGRCRLGICVALDEVYGWRVRAEQMAYNGVGMLFACQGSNFQLLVVSVYAGEQFFLSRT